MGADLRRRCPVVAQQLGRELVPDGLWAIVEPLIPPRTERPQGSGTRYVDELAVFTASVYVLTTGCAWRHPSGRVRHIDGHRAPPLRDLDRAWAVAAAAPGGAGSAR
jgi:hypothetical protein